MWHLCLVVAICGWKHGGRGRGKAPRGADNRHYLIIRFFVEYLFVAIISSRISLVKNNLSV